MKVGIICPYRYHLSDKALEKYLPKNTTEIICTRVGRPNYMAAIHSLISGVKLTPVTDNYEIYGRYARIRRNTEIIRKSQFVIIFDPGNSAVVKRAEKYCNHAIIPMVKVKILESDLISDLK